MEENNEKEMDPIKNTDDVKETVEEIIETEVITVEEEKVADVVEVVEEKKEEAKTDTTVDADAKKEKEANDLSLASMILGIVSIIMCCCSTYIGLGTGITAIVLSVMAGKKSSKKNPKKTAGLVLGIITCSIFAIYIVCVVIYGAALFTGALSSIY